MAMLTVNREPRIGCGTCVEVCPDVFATGGDKVACVIDPDLAITQRACAAEADSCPQLAIAEVDE
jgi:NAD-dependent dihydropyrimidine dehydrogenase PreA subunit